MASSGRWQESIRVGFQVFARDGGEEYGTVRDVCPGGRTRLLVNIENGGDSCLPFDAIVDVHSEKVMVDAKRLDRRCAAPSRTRTTPNAPAVSSRDGRSRPPLRILDQFSRQAVPFVGVLSARVRPGPMGVPRHTVCTWSVRLPEGDERWMAGS